MRLVQLCSSVGQPFQRIRTDLGPGSVPHFIRVDGTVYQFAVVQGNGRVPVYWVAPIVDVKRV